MKKTIKLYNTATRKIEEFKPIKNESVGIYTCGPTVYDQAHIGNLRAYVFSDILYRFLKSMGYKVKWVMNITDIDDKTLARARKEGKSLCDITEKFYSLFLEDLRAINVRVDEIKFVKATEHFEEMRALVDVLIKKGYAYEAEDGVYFDVSKFKDYGKFAGVNVNEANSRSRINNDTYDKESVQDFALWKNDPDYPKGRPGWHIECSAMSEKYLGLPFDIHTGGIDLVFPHHQNEIAQTKAATGKDLANYWLHNEHLLVEGKKMAKSENNFYTLRDVVGHHFTPQALRLELMKAHYRSKLDFSWENMKGCETVLQEMKRFWAHSNIANDSNVNLDVEYNKFISAMSDDLNVPDALAVVHEVINDPKNLGLAGRDFLRRVDKVLGLGITADAPESVIVLAKAMDDARKENNFEESDRLRKKIDELGYVVENSPDGSYAIKR